MVQADLEQVKKGINPLIWVSIIVIGLILFIFLGSDRGSVKTETLQLEDQHAQIESQVVETAEGLINRDALVPPGLRARKFIGQVRQNGRPYPLEELMAKASIYVNEGSLADAHLTFFFVAREGHVEAMMMMAEMSDPTLFQSENNLLDKADPVQAYKWYQLALSSGFEPAQSRLDNLYQWAVAEAKFGNVEAEQLLLNFN
ncbi:MAG: hypothetical protein GY744_03220 [Gammaproteobacteria bacterium]|nr:hypothetical protein [Gammaproteobacteria bacterium]